MELFYVWRKVGLICSFQSYKGLIRLESGDQTKAWGFFWYFQKIVESLLAVVIGFLFWLIKRHGWHSETCDGKLSQWVNEKQSRMDTHSGPAKSTHSACHFACDLMWRTVACGDVRPKVSMNHPRQPVRSFSAHGFIYQKQKKHSLLPNIRIRRQQSQKQRCLSIFSSCAASWALSITDRTNSG